MFTEGLKKPRGGNSWQPRHSDSQELDVARHAGGQYVYVVDDSETVFVVPDGPHRHPQVLGRGLQALYAGEVALNKSGWVTELNNLSGTFQFQSSDGLRCVAEKLQQRGISIDQDALTYYDPAGSTGGIAISLP